MNDEFRSVVYKCGYDELEFDTKVGVAKVNFLINNGVVNTSVFNNDDNDEEAKEYKIVGTNYYIEKDTLVIELEKIPEPRLSLDVEF